MTRFVCFIHFFFFCYNKSIKLSDGDVLETFLLGGDDADDGAVSARLLKALDGVERKIRSSIQLPALDGPRKHIAARSPSEIGRD